MNFDQLREFVMESNAIEAICREPSLHEIAALEKFLDTEELTILDFVKFLSVNQPGAFLRDAEGMNVRVGVHLPPPGGPKILLDLGSLLEDVKSGVCNTAQAYDVHAAYETLHPFTDGNGRSGRALWLWIMVRQDPGSRYTDQYFLGRGFLHTWYYQSLNNWRE